ncbi:MAG: hypothetical protein ACPGSD_12215 [Flavobacteriales bacterium]
MEKELEHIESSDVKENWELLGPIYIKLKDALEKEKQKEEYDDEVDFDVFYDIMLEEWKKIYLEVVLNPIREKITDLFKKALATDYVLKDPIDYDGKVFCVHYYILQYFSIGVLPYHKHEDFPDVSTSLDELGNINLDLYSLFEYLWYELELDEETEEELFYDRSEFYDVEVSYLTAFLSECWLKAKQHTGVNAIAILDESTAVGETYLLDENKLLEDCDEEIKALIK